MNRPSELISAADYQELRYSKWQLLRMAGAAGVGAAVTTWGYDSDSLINKSIAGVVGLLAGAELVHAMSPVISNPNPPLPNVRHAYDYTSHR